jgi:hypothetical protein
MKTSITPSQFAEYLQAEGYKAKVEQDDDGDTTIRSSSSGFNWSVDFGSGDEELSRFTFTFLTWVKESANVARLCNEFNQKSLVGVAWHGEESDKDGDLIVVLQLHVNLSGGVTDLYLQELASRFDAGISIFHKVYNGLES